MIYIIVAGPVLDYDKKLETQTVKSGSMFIINVNVTGTPNPKLQWLHKDNPISVSSRAKVETSNNYTTLQVKGSEPSDGGKYKLVAQNKVGIAEAEFTVNILGK